MERRISAKEMNSGSVNCELNSGDTIIITGDRELDWLCFNEFILDGRSDKAYHLILENGQKEIEDNWNTGSKESWLGCILSLTAPDLVYIGDFNFLHCSKLSRVYFPKLKIIGEGAFGYCQSLKDIDLPNVEKIGVEAFYDCENLERINAPKVKMISDSAFAYCDSLEEVCFPEAEIVEDYAFLRCLNLHRAILPKVSNEVLASSILEDCVNLREINLASIREICVGEFSGYVNLRTIDISSVEEIEDRAFKDCFNLRRIKATSAKLIGQEAFMNCIHLEELEMPEVEGILGGCFYGCVKLKRAEFDKISEVSAGAFESCNGLEEVIMPQVTAVYDSAFEGCKYLKMVEMPLLKELGVRSFYGCSNIEELNIPEEVFAWPDSFSVGKSALIGKIKNRVVRKYFEGFILRKAEVGDSVARFIAGCAYETGEYVCGIGRCPIGRDVNLSQKLLKQSAEQKMPEAMNKLYHTEIKKTDLKELETDSRSIMELGDCYRLGIYVEKDIEEARRLYRISFRQGNALVLERLIQLQRNISLNVEIDVPTDEVESVYFKAERGDIEAIRTIASWYATGTGEIVQDHRKAELFEALADKLSKKNNNFPDHISLRDI